MAMPAKEAVPRPPLPTLPSVVPTGQERKYEAALIRRTNNQFRKYFNLRICVLNDLTKLQYVFTTGHFFHSQQSVKRPRCGKNCYYFISVLDEKVRTSQASSELENRVIGLNFSNLMIKNP